MQPEDRTSGPHFVDCTAEVATITGEPGRYRSRAGAFSVPIRYTDARSLLVTQLAPLSALRELLPEGVQPRRVFGTYGALAVQFSCFPQTTIGAYDECIIAVVAKDQRHWPAPRVDLTWEAPPCYSIWLAVSSELALVSGQALWGYPKAIGETSLECSGDTLRAQVRVAGRPIIECVVARPAGLEPSNIRLRSVSYVRGQLRRTAVYGQCNLGALSDVPGELVFSPGARVSETLAALPREAGLASVMHLTGFDFTLPLPLEV